MLATGVALAGAQTEATQAAARRRVAQGLGRWTAQQLAYRRYAPYTWGTLDTTGAGMHTIAGWFTVVN